MGRKLGIRRRAASHMSAEGVGQKACLAHVSCLHEDPGLPFSTEELRRHHAGVYA